MRKIYWAIFFLLLTTCVDPIKFNSTDAQFQLVVDGMISDEPGPYRVSLRSIESVGFDFSKDKPFVDPGAVVSILSDAGEKDILVPDSDGIYKTTFIQGQVGRTYTLRIERNGHIYESTPEKMAPIGDIEAVNYEFTPVIPEIMQKVPTLGTFRIFVDGRTSGGNKYVRWRLLGTYQVTNYPEAHTKFFDGFQVPDPLPCSGVDLNLHRRAPCTCCVCWISEYGLPIVSDDQLVTNGLFRKVNVGSVIVNRRTFSDQYYAEVEQMSLTEPAFNFWKAIQAQKEGAASLFQPAIGKVTGNMFSKNDPATAVNGYFAAAAVKRKGIFLTRELVPFYIESIDSLNVACTDSYRNSTNIKPIFWK